ncbi:LTA synthase family protein [Chryseolinea lacunae]|uniref:Sulfatase-like hydrolase/transferase n=1 Tax=Chryseolinea lacunae TaxID=2801331 RepID=A0ABS1L1C8_9BACT|nr:alkaline phosphatase family protein [Chryseolinea lacunae]MBL0745258.1 sulfatase-like hydrolase/transferase [Chryseolinea lacunae]
MITTFFKDGRASKYLYGRFGLAIVLVLLLVSISFLTRLVFLMYSWPDVAASFGNLLGIFFLGLFFDLINSAYFVIPVMLYLWLIPQRVYGKRWHRVVLMVLLTFFTFLLLFNAVAEWFFWEEFNTRFNFIAVDYLVYTNEVLGNIQQSYPIGAIVGALVVVCGLILYPLWHIVKRLPAAEPVRFRKRSTVFLAYAVLPVLFFFSVNSKYHQFSSNAFVNELAGNGMYELFAAYLNNELNYDQFYATIPQDKAFAELRDMIKTPEATFVTNDPFDIRRRIVHTGEEKKLNVVMISVESLSGEFLTAFGSTVNITPFMDSLAQHSLFFTNLYATGTRTVRGLEALSLCVPPTPGQSIVRRPHNENLFSLGKVFEEKGYESKYIYGGYGYFDNMNYFFANNGYTVVDRSELADTEIDYENIWGVADENLFTLALREIDKTVKSNTPAFAHIMTTSNHRPYTYPEGRIDIPSHTGREGAVKYTDYAIGDFIKRARHKPWFDSTIFVVVADHCASSAGKTELPINKYHIPLLIYSPANIAPAKMERLMSQIDLGPTLLGLLNFSYESKFYGYDIFQLEPGRERVFISTYQNLGFIRDSKMVVLSPQRKQETFNITFGSDSVTRTNDDKALAAQAISWYQAASYAFREGLMK